MGLEVRTSIRPGQNSFALTLPDLTKLEQADESLHLEVVTGDVSCSPWQVDKIIVGGGMAFTFLKVTHAHPR